MSGMLLDADTAWLALQQRDAQFDGRLFVGVTSTGIYCRPICRVRRPRRENCRFFESAAQAEAARFRPCLKCCPERAPGPGPAWSVMDASRTLAAQAAEGLDRLAFELPTETPAVAGLASRLGISDRHLRHIFIAAYGVTPLRYLQTRRLLQARQLLTDSRLPITQIALASGFRSLRRFQAAFLEHYRMPPGALRRHAQPPAARPVEPTSPPASADAGPPVPATRRPPPAEPLDNTLELRLGYRPPLDVRALLGFLSKRAVPGIETVDPSAGCVRRSLRAGAMPEAGQLPGWLEVQFEPARAQLRLRLDARLAPWTGAVTARVRRWLDLDADPMVIGRHLRDAGLEPDLPDGPIPRRHAPGAAIEDDPPAVPVADPNGSASCLGLRLPGGTDGFEIGVRAVLGQRVTVAAARTLAGRLVRDFGSELQTPWPGLDRGFPAPDTLAADGERLGRLGLLRRQIAAIQALARIEPELQAIEAGGGPPALQAQALIRRLLDLPGLGPWSAHYLAMRRLGWADAFPPGDVAVLNALGLGRNAAALREAERRAEAWRPWRSYAVLHLWRSLENRA